MGEYPRVDTEEDPFEFLKMLEKAKTLKYSTEEVVKRPENTGVIEPGLDAKTFDLDKVKKTVKVSGFELKEPPKPKKGAERRALKRSDRLADYRRNMLNYGILCRTCMGSGKCPECKGRGRVKLIFRCRGCGGDKKCPDCEKDAVVDCPQCKEPMSRFSDTCTKCGLLIHCPKCYSPLPAMSTKCMSCKTEFVCSSCGKPYPRPYSWRCPHCRHWNERKTRRLPVK